VVPWLAPLFAGAGSLTAELTEAVFNTEPSVVAVTTTLTLALAPAATVPSGHETVPAANEHVPWEGVAET
jgi:hypothetical protein